MTTMEFVLLALVVAAAVTAGYFIGRWSADREIGARSARPSPLPGPDEIPAGYDDSEEPNGLPAPRAPSRPRGAPPPASAGGDHVGPAATTPPRPRSAAPPPASAGGGTAASSGAPPEASRQRRGPPPPAAAGVMGTGDPSKRER